MSEQEYWQARKIGDRISGVCVGCAYEDTHRINLPCRACDRDRESQFCHYRKMRNGPRIIKIVASKP